MDFPLFPEFCETATKQCTDQLEKPLPASNVTIDHSEDVESCAVIDTEKSPREKNVVNPRVCFFDLPYEIRLLVYHQLTVNLSSRALDPKEYQMRRWYICPLSKANRTLHWEIDDWIRRTWVFRIRLREKDLDSRIPGLECFWSLPPPEFASGIRHLHITGWCKSWDLHLLFTRLKRAGFTWLKELTVEHMRLPSPNAWNDRRLHPDGDWLEHTLSRIGASLKVKEVKKGGRMVQVMNVPCIADVISLGLFALRFEAEEECRS